MARNTLAGTKTGKSKSAKYYQSNPEAKKQKAKYDTEYHNTPSRIKYRSKLNQANRERDTYGNKDKMDMSHTKEGTLKKERQSTNRARQGANKKSTKK